ncbi:MAG: glycosyltransferase family 2 protein [Gemmataceae bacterium]
MIELSVVMPVYNEREALPTTLDDAVSALAGAPFPYEIVLVDDASTDDSLAILEAYRDRHPDVIRVLRHERNRGIAGACQTLYDAARGRYVFINGSDGQWKTAECLRMMALRDRFDVIVGKRRRKQYGWWRGVVSGSFNALPRLLLGVATHDAGSIKLFRRDVLSIPLLSRGPFREAERIARARRRGLRVGSIPVDQLPRQGGVAGGAKMTLVAGAVLDLGRCWWDMVALGGR